MSQMKWVGFHGIPEKIWTPHNGLGMSYVFDRLNDIYGEGFIKYK